MRINLFLPTLFFLVSLASNAQGLPESGLHRRMDLAVDLMEQGHYEEADGHFMYVIRHLTTLPANLAYYFGKNSHHLSKYKQSINWLNKYIQLKGTEGRYYDDALRYLERSEEKYLSAQQASQAGLEASLEPEEFDCGGMDKMLCPVCKGQGVIVKQGAFDRLYQTCPYSSGEAYLTCEEYNQFMQGRLKPKL